MTHQQGMVNLCFIYYDLLLNQQRIMNIAYFIFRNRIFLLYFIQKSGSLNENSYKFLKFR